MIGEMPFQPLPHAPHSIVRFVVHARVLVGADTSLFGRIKRVLILKERGRAGCSLRNQQRASLDDLGGDELGIVSLAAFGATVRQIPLGLAKRYGKHHPRKLSDLTSAGFRQRCWAQSLQSVPITNFHKSSPYFRL
jgi:hypothetical protein